MEARIGAGGDVVGLVLAFGLSGLLIYWGYDFVRSRETRKKALEDFRSNPLPNLVFLGLIVFFVMCFGGALIPRVGQIRLRLGGIDLEIWQLGGIGFLATLVIGSMLNRDNRR